MKKNDMSYEQAVARLGEIVESLEKGNMPLSQSLTFFEEGTALIKYCTQLRLERLWEDGTNRVELPFEEET